MGNLSSTPSTTTTHSFKHEVFLSFRGEDTREGFTGHLYDALHRKQIETFIDNKLIRGDEISSALLRAIGESKIAVVIFSQDYVFSKWCLRELGEIMKCKKINNQIVIPVFYGITPSDLRKQIESFMDFFAKHKQVSQGELQTWREAITEASNISGWDSSKTRLESKFVCKIVRDIWTKLYDISPSSDFQGLVGIYERIERVITLLCLGVSDFRIIGICGMGGIGKTTIAEAVFKVISNQFESSYICLNFREKAQKNDGLTCLQKEVLSKLLNVENLKLCSPSIPLSIKNRLSCKKVFIVLDDVDDFRKLEILDGGLNQFGSGSRILLTGRDKQELRNCGVNDHNMYEVEELNWHEALKLFCNYAFRQNHPIEDFMVLSKEVVNYAKGNPLALKILGSSLYRKSKQEWQSSVDKLQRIFNPEILNVLKISFDVLDDEEKDLFLDIACFFEGYFDFVIAELLDCKISLSGLIDKSLITISKHRIEMHDLLQEMGRDIVRSGSEKKKNKPSRLWKRDDVICALKNNSGTNEVEGISLDMDDLEDVHLSLSCQVFDKMHNLRILLFKIASNSEFIGVRDPSGPHRLLNRASILTSIKVYILNGLNCLPNRASILTSIKVYIPNGLNCLPNTLRILQWHLYPLRALPSNFYPEKLVELDLSYSNIKQLWKGTKHKHAPKLKRLFLNHCLHLTRIPHLLDFPSLEIVELRNCKSLVGFPSVQHCNKLWYLDLSGCIAVTEFPLISRNIKWLILSGTAIEEVPSSIQSLTNLIGLDLSECTRLKHISTGICKLKSLDTLNLRDCSQLETFPEILETMEILESLELSGTAIRELPSSIEHLNGLPSLRLYNCKNLEILPSSICNWSSLEDLNLSNCPKLDKLPENLGNLKSLRSLIVRESAISQLPSSMACLENLDFLDCSGCRGLTILPPLSGLCSLTRLFLNDCNLMEIPEDIGSLSSLNELHLCGNIFECLPQSIKQLSKLELLSLRDCSMLRSLTELPVALRKLEAMNCEELCQALPDASEFVRCSHSKYGVQFLFTNSFNLDHKAVSNIFKESLVIRQRTEKESENLPTRFSIHLPGSEIPEWFSYQSPGASVNVKVLRRDLVNRKFMGFAICAVLGFERFNRLHDYLLVEVYCQFETHDDQICFPALVKLEGCRVFINSDHILLGYSSLSEFYSLSQNLEKLLVSDGDSLDISFELKNRTEFNYKVKYCAVHPIYAEEPIKII